MLKFLPRSCQRKTFFVLNLWVICTAIERRVRTSAVRFFEHFLVVRYISLRWLGAGLCFVRPLQLHNLGLVFIFVLMGLRSLSSLHHYFWSKSSGLHNVLGWRCISTPLEDLGSDFLGCVIIINAATGRNCGCSRWALNSTHESYWPEWGSMLLRASSQW